MKKSLSKVGMVKNKTKMGHVTWWNPNRTTEWGGWSHGHHLAMAVTSFHTLPLLPPPTPSLTFIPWVTPAGMWDFQFLYNSLLQMGKLGTRGVKGTPHCDIWEITPPGEVVVAPQEFDKHALSVSMTPGCFTMLFFLNVFMLKRKDCRIRRRNFSSYRTALIWSYKKERHTSPAYWNDNWVLFLEKVLFIL